jgi:hypothetical protein
MTILLSQYCALENGSRPTICRKYKNSGLYNGEM